jgi:hypothetical protein
MIKSIRSRNWNLAGAIEELVDNSLGHGKATEIVVYIDNAKGIAVMDNGLGVDDVNRIFRLGDASSHDDWAEIGQYGVGAKHATIYLGNKITVKTVRDDRFHTMTVDWADVEESGQWPLAYRGTGKKPTEDEIGTRVLIQELAHHYRLSTSEGLARDLGQVFSPALRRGVEISVHHYLAGGGYQIVDVKPFSPADLTNEIEISGTITTRGTLRWTGRAGLSASLTERFNGVHISFGHRVIETTREPFAGESAPTLYVEVALDETTPWKHALSEHKDKVVRYRKELINSIHAEIRELLKASSQQASYLALKMMTAPIEAQLTRALKGAGVLHVDPDEEPVEGGGGDGPGPVEPGSHVRSAVDDGDPAKEAKRPTGIQIDWRKKEQLEGKLWSWEISGRQMVILLDEDQFKPTIGYPPKLRDQLVIQLVAAILSHAVEMEYLVNEPALIAALTPKLHKQVQEWAQNHNAIAPYLNRAILDSVG